MTFPPADRSRSAPSHPDQPDQPDRPGRSGQRPAVPTAVYLLAVVNACVGVGYGIVAPAIPLFAKQFGVSDLAASSVVSVYALARVVTAFGAGRATVRFGEARVLAGGLAVTAATSLLAAGAWSFLSLMVLRGIGGAGTAMFTVAGQSLLLRLSPPGARGRAASVFQSGFVAGFVAGPLLGGVISAWSLRLPLVVYGLALATGGVLVAVALRRAVPDVVPGAVAGAGSGAGAVGPGGASVGTAVRSVPLRTAWAHQGYRAAVANNIANGWVGNGVRFTLMPLFVVGALGEGTAWSGIGLMIGSVLQAVMIVPAGRMIDRWGARGVSIVGGVLSAAGALVVTCRPGLSEYLVAMAVWGVSGSLLAGAGPAATGAALRGGAGTPVAVFQVAFDLGTMIGPVVCGLVADRWSYQGAFGTAVLICLAATAVSLPRWPDDRDDRDDRRAGESDESGGVEPARSPSAMGLGTPPPGAGGVGDPGGPGTPTRMPSP